MKVKIDKSRRVYKGTSNSGRINENNYEVLEFVFPEELEDFTKYIEIEATDNEGTLRYVDRIENNEFVINNTLSKYNSITAQIICKDLIENVVFKSAMFELNFDESLNIMEDIEEEQQDLLDRIELELQEAKEDITDLQETQEQHTEQIQTNTTDIEDLQERVTTNETDIANIKTKNTQQDTAIGTNTQDISNIKSEQTTQNTNITSNTNRITVLESQSGNKVALSIDSNYVMTLQLLNKSNEVLSTGTIDLPIESMVVNASYRNGILTLTLQNGQTLNVDISDIVSGLVSETTFNSAVTRLEGLISGLDERITTAETNISSKVDKVAGKSLSTNDYTTAEKNKLAGLENYDDTEVKADIQENADDIATLEAKHDTEVAELNEKIADLQEELDMTADLIPTDSPEPSTNITINDSARYTFKEFEVGGNSEQTTTSIEGGDEYDSPSPDYPQEIRNVGDNVNLFDKDNANILNALISQTNGVLNGNDARKTLYMNCKPNTTYTVSKNNKGSNNSFVVATSSETPVIGGSTTNFIAGNNNSSLIITSAGNDRYLLVQYYRTDETSVTEEEILNSIKVEEGSNPTGYSSYNYGSVDVKVESGNIFDGEMELGEINVSNGANVTSTSQIRTVNHIDVKRHRNIAIVTDNNSIQTKGLRFYDKNKNYLGRATSTNNNVFNIDELTLSNTTQYYNSNDDIYYMRFTVTTSTDLSIKYGVMINSTDYVPHEEQTVTFPTAEGQVLHLGDTLEDDGVHQRRAIKVLDGTENWSIQNSGTENWYYHLLSTTQNAQLPLCTHYVAAQIINTNTLQGIYFTNNALRIRYGQEDTIENFKTWLAEQYANGTPVTVEFTPNSDPIIVPYNEAQQEAYNKIKELYTYKGTTHISSDNNPSPIFTVTYRKDPNIRDTRLDALEARVALLEG